MLETAVSYLRSLTPAEKIAFAKKCGIKRGYLYNIMCGSKSPSVLLACRMEKASRGRITRREILPALDWELLADGDEIKD